MKLKSILLELFLPVPKAEQRTKGQNILFNHCSKPYVRRGFHVIDFVDAKVCLIVSRPNQKVSGQRMDKHKMAAVLLMDLWDSLKIFELRQPQTGLKQQTQYTVEI